ncbi:hypothetical protein EVAR_24578_1 [Eumeta japonica]|uniref:Uncharacterized protein n=1 Tax=Eumeta variegata TaxID=151549 RepID=A0A4C1W537_EUMVA|nr:hypothetical protein EVAR_24578_1 [Eumeta japonica]
MLVLDEGGEGGTAQAGHAVGRWWTPTGSRRHASVTRVGVDLTERACRPLIRLSMRRTAAARAVRVSEPRPSTFSFLSVPRDREKKKGCRHHDKSWCRSGAYAGPPAGARVITHVLDGGWEGHRVVRR